MGGSSIHCLANGRSQSHEVPMMFQVVLYYQTWLSEIYSTSCLQTLGRRFHLATWQPVLPKAWLDSQAIGFISLPGDRPHI